MPRGFLVKRQKSASTFSYRARHNSEGAEDRSDSGSEPGDNWYVSTHPFGSPDSGYCQSPVSLTFKDQGARLLTTTYPEVNAAGADSKSSSGRSLIEGDATKHHEEDLEEQTQPMDYSTTAVDSRTTSTITYNGTVKKELHSSSTITNDNENLASRRPASIPEAIPHLTRPDSAHNSREEHGVSNPTSRYHHHHLLQQQQHFQQQQQQPSQYNFNTAAEFYSQLKFHHPQLQYHPHHALNGRLPPPPPLHVAAPGSAASTQEESMMVETGRPESTCSSSPRSSPAPSVGTPTHTSSSQGSPFYFSNFDRHSMSSPGGTAKSTTGPTSMPSPAASSKSSTTTGSAPGTPGSPGGKKRGASTMSNGTATTTGESKPKTPKKTKAMRKIKFELEDKSSPVSGTFIRDESDMADHTGGTVVCGDIDSSMNMVEATPEAREELERIENKIGDYVCQLCKEFYNDAFQLAQHKCSRIVHIEYRCPECDKLFNCPANLASHRRWHKPRPANNNNNNKNSNNSNNNNNNNKNDNTITTDVTITSTIEEQQQVINTALPPGQTTIGDVTSNITRQTPSPGVDSNEGLFECEQCGKKFRRQAYLRKHMASHNSTEADAPFPCQFCGKVLRSETARAKHVLQHALGAAPLAGVTGTKDFPCGVCPAVFPSRPTLERHARLHTSEVYSCKYCSNTFYSSPSLTRHINKCHPSENRQVILLQMPGNRPC